MSDTGESKSAISRRKFMKTGAVSLAGPILGPYSGQAIHQAKALARALDEDPVTSHIYHSRNGTPAQNVAKVIEMAYGGIENFVGQDDIVLLRPNLQWARNGYTNSEIGIAMIDLILNRPGGFTGEIIVIENVHADNPHTASHSGWCTSNTESNGPYNWFEVIQYFLDNASDYPDGVHTDPVTGQINVSFQFLTDVYEFTLEDPHPILTTYGGEHYAGGQESLDGSVNPFVVLKYNHSTKTCLYVYRSDIRYTNEIARISPIRRQYYMNYPVFKSQHSGLYVSLYKGHPTPWNPNTEEFTSQRVRLINMTTLNHHGPYAGVTSVVKGHFGMTGRTFHSTGWDAPDPPPTFYYAGGAVGYWLATIRQADLHMSCAERIGRISRHENDAFQAKSVAISTDPVALDYYVGKNILFPAGGMYGLDGAEAAEPWSNDASLEGGYYRLTLELCRDPLADHSIINGTLDEEEMAVHLHDFDHQPGDFDQDGDVDLADYQHFHACSNGPGQPPAQANCCDTDLDGDSDVDLADFDRLLDFFGNSN